MFKELLARLIAYPCLLLFFLASCGGSDASLQYVAIGASDATGIGAFPPSEGYVFRIQEGIDNTCGSTELVNLGIPAAEADDIANLELPVARELDPELISIWIGSNDLVSGRDVEDFRNDLGEIIGTLALDSDALVFVANLPNLPMLPRFQDEPDPNVTEERVEAFNMVIEEEVLAAGASLVDLSQIPLSDVLVSEDGFHPSNEGHGAIAQIFLSNIIPALCS